MVSLTRSTDGVTVKVLYPLLITGAEAIWTQLEKLLDDTMIDPEQAVLTVFVVKVLPSIALSNVTDIEVPRGTSTAFSIGLVAVTTGRITSTVMNPAPVVY